MGWGFGPGPSGHSAFGSNASSHDAGRKTWVGAGTSAPQITETPLVTNLLQSFVGAVPANFNMLPWGAFSQFTDFTSVFTLTRATVAGGVESPSAVDNAQSLIEDSSNSTHFVSWLPNAPFGAFAQTNLPHRMRTAVIAQKAGRSRIVVVTEFVGHETSVSAAVGFDLAGGNVGYDQTTGSLTTITLSQMTNLGAGWWLCVYEWEHTLPYTGFAVGVTARINLDSGSGTAARSISYLGDGAHGVNLWWFNLLPAAAWILTNPPKMYDDFDSTNTIDLADTRAPGFKWYIHNSAPKSDNTLWWSAANLPPALPGDFTLSSPSVLKIYNPNNNSPTWASLMYSVGFLDEGGYVGTAWGPPLAFDAYVSWDGSKNPANFGGQGPALWGHTIEPMLGTTDHWVEWDWVDNGLTTTSISDRRIANPGDNPADSSWPITIGAPHNLVEGTFYRLSGLWLDMASNANGWGFFASFNNGQWIEQSDRGYKTGLMPVPNNGAYPLDLVAIVDTQHFPIMINTANNVGSGPGGGWPMFIDWVRIYTT